MLIHTEIAGDQIPRDLKTENKISPFSNSDFHNINPCTWLVAVVHTSEIQMNLGYFFFRSFKGQFTAKYLESL